MRAVRSIDEGPRLFGVFARLDTVAQLVGCAARLSGRNAGFTAPEKRLIADARPADGDTVEHLRAEICDGGDPLGDAYARLRPAVVRRACGAVYTPWAIVRSMMQWAGQEQHPVRVVDPGTGSGRFLIAAAQQFPQAALVAVETDPIAALLLRANASVHRFSGRLTIELADYRQITLARVNGATLFIGNPPYVRHHEIPERWKTWFAQTAARYGLKASKLAGLHIHFFLKTRQLVRPGDYGAFITSAEWLDVNYGSVLRALLGNGLGGQAIHILAPQLQPFSDALTTAAITCFRVGDASGQLRIRRVAHLRELGQLGDSAHDGVSWSVLQRARKWSGIGKNAMARPGFAELGELFRVHRGQVTGANGVWIAGRYPGRLPSRVLVPTVTRARELLAVGAVLGSSDHLRCVIDLPANLDSLADRERELVEKFLDWARQQGAHQSYIARHRTPWWAVGLRAPAPVLCTYMARRPPAFVRNLCAARHLNIAHGLYPRTPLAEPALEAVTRYLSTHVRIESGRTYAGGLTKFEPKELERLPIPKLENLHAGAEALES